MEPISRSAYAFCHGERGAVRISSMPIACCGGHPSGEGGITIVHHVPRRLVPRERFAEVVAPSRRRGVVGGGDVHDPTALVRQDHEHEQEPTCRRRHHEEVGSGDLGGVVRQERAPRLRWRRSRSRHLFGNRGLRHVEAEFQELAVKPWCTPERILLRHPLNT